MKLDADLVVLDIETTGLGPTDKISLVGLYGEGKVVQYLPHDFKDLRVTCNTLVSFNGEKFDLPFLARETPPVQISFNRHVDLMKPARVFLCNNGRPIDDRTQYISKDQACRLMGIYVPKDPAGSGLRCALIGRRSLSPELPADELERAQLALHNATDLYATLALYKVFQHEGWI